MATPSQFNRPYAELKGGTGSLANRAATPSGRGYYDPARILERVARGRPGTTMQQAQGAIAAEGYKEYDKLRSQMGQQQNQGQGGMGTEAEATSNIPTFTPNQNLLTGYMNLLGQAPATVAPTTPLTKPKKPLPAPPALQSSITPDQAGETMPSWFKPFGL